MIELQQLRQLVAISENGTLSNAAQSLYISQPALSRSMQKLEQDIEAELFERQKNKIVLNDNGALAVECAKKLLGDYDAFVQTVRDFDRSRRTISVGACAPAPIWQIVPKLCSRFPEMTVMSEIKDVPHLERELLRGDYAIIATTERPDSPDCITREFCHERLLLCVNADHKLAKKSSLRFADLAGITMLLYDDIGIWKDIGKELPDTRFIVQTDRRAFDELAAESNLPYFATDLSLAQFAIKPEHIAIPIAEAHALKTFYLSAFKKNRHLLDALLSAPE